jgi:hypothetical protein
MKTTTKIWSCVGVFSTLAAAATTAATASPDVFKGDFKGALAKMMEGEGGEGGLGTYFAEGRMVIPPLKGAQVQEVFSGNSLRRSTHYALHFAKDGTVSGWERLSETVDKSKCTPDKAPAYAMDDGECKFRQQVQLAPTKWKVNGDKLCTQPALNRATEGTECVSVFLVLNEVALVGPGDKMIGKGSRISKGKVLDPVR